MNEESFYNRAGLPKSEYARIEKTVVDLYEELGVSRIPINPFEVARKKGYVIIPFSKMSKETLKLLKKTASSGASIRNEEGTYKIFYDDSDSPRRQRFTVMHEIGHILLGHKQDSEYAEKCANYYASYALSPTPLISLSGCEDYIELADKFFISFFSASIAFERCGKWKRFSRNVKAYETRLKALFGYI